MPHRLAALAALPILAALLAGCIGGGLDWRDHFPDPERLPYGMRFAEPGEVRLPEGMESNPGPTPLDDAEPKPLASYAGLYQGTGPDGDIALLVLVVRYASEADERAAVAQELRDCARERSGEGAVHLVASPYVVQVVAGGFFQPATQASDTLGAAAVADLRDRIGARTPCEAFGPPPAGPTGLEDLLPTAQDLPDGMELAPAFYNANPGAYRLDRALHGREFGHFDEGRPAPPPVTHVATYWWEGDPYRVSPQESPRLSIAAARFDDPAARDFWLAAWGRCVPDTAVVVDGLRVALFTANLVRTQPYQDPTGPPVPEGVARDVAAVADAVAARLGAEAWCHRPERRDDGDGARSAARPIGFGDAEADRFASAWDVDWRAFTLDAPAVVTVHLDCAERCRPPALVDAHGEEVALPASGAALEPGRYFLQLRATDATDYRLGLQRRDPAGA